MRFSLTWLKKYVDIPESPEALAHGLTMAGFEVEKVEVETVLFEGVIVGKIGKLSPHPQADRLTLCDVTAGRQEYKIVCGASNMKVGDHVALALPGARLAQGLKIKATKLRGVLSEGMLCSEKELGLATASEGIMILPKTTVIGAPLSDFIVPDVALDMAIAPNRGDCLSHIGLAREIAAIFGKGKRKVRFPKIALREKKSPLKIAVKVQDSLLCPRYMGRIIDGVAVAESPAWLKQSLESIGIRSINNVVDVTNYIMLAWGQPLHAFDYSLIQGEEIHVREAKGREFFTTLDGIQRTLEKGDILICDAKKIVALGGIMGGVGSETSLATTRIFLESAYFHPIAIRRTSKRLGLRTESSIRFERGVSFDGVERALDHAATLIQELAGGVIKKGGLDVSHPPRKTSPIPLQIERVSDLLGIDVPQTEVSRILSSLGFSLSPKKQRNFSVTPPFYRKDVALEADLVEEVARIYGYDKIPATLPAGGVVNPEKYDAPSDVAWRGLAEEGLFTETTRNILVGLGLSEVVNFSFISIKELDRLHMGSSAIAIKNPLGEEWGALRTSLVPSLLKTATFNLRHSNRNLNLFELRKVYSQSVGDESAPHERLKLGIFLSGSSPQQWMSPERSIDFFDLKGIIESLLRILRLEGRYVSCEDYSFLHPGKQAKILLGDKEIGYLGELHPNQNDLWDLSERCLVSELDVERLEETVDAEFHVTPLSKFPTVRRDVSILVEEHRTVESLEEVLKKTKIPHLAGIQLFDLYRGEKIPKGKKSLSFTLTYQSFEKTLTDREVDRAHEKAIQVLQQLGSEIR